MEDEDAWEEGGVGGERGQLGRRQERKVKWMKKMEKECVCVCVWGGGGGGEGRGGGGGEIERLRGEADEQKDVQVKGEKTG